MKSKGSDEPFRKIELSEIVDIKDLPGFDYSVKWKVKDDKPPRRRLPSDPPKRNQAGNLRRQLSVSSTEGASSKKLRSDTVIADCENMDEEEASAQTNGKDPLGGQ